MITDFSGNVEGDFWTNLCPCTVLAVHMVVFTVQFISSRILFFFPRNGIWKIASIACKFFNNSVNAYSKSSALYVAAVI